MSALVLVCVWPAAAPAPAVAQVATFRAGVDLVSISAVVRDRRGRLVRDLAQDDFVIHDGGEPREIRGFRIDDRAPIRVALLLDGSGSMQVGRRVAEAQWAAETLLARLALENGDQAAVFHFDRDLDARIDFTDDRGGLLEAVHALEAFGQTSLYDAVGDAARRIGAADAPRTAIVLLTDGIDTASRMSAAEVSGIASAIDVPVYVMVLVPQVDRRAEARAAELARETPRGTLANLAWWTGGELLFISSREEAGEVASRLLSELRHQYVIAFESAAEPGWRPLDIRARDSRLTVRARSGYFAGQTRSIGTTGG